MLAILSGAGQVQAETRAVLVGVSDYQFLDVDLLGPRNDVRIMAAALIARGVPAANITVLTDDRTGIDPAVLVVAPTRDQILAALDALAATSQSGDTALFYFSGHGAQMPDDNGDEAGGYDEIFLPSDAKAWNGRIGRVENAIVDDELQTRARAILARGARLVAILDACHSGTGFRALPARGVARFVDPSVLGVPEATEEETNTRPAQELTGDFVFLYSSQSDQRSFEYGLTSAAADDAWYGDFTRNLVATLQTRPNLTWGQILQVTDSAMRKGSGAPVQTPDGEGPMLTETAFGDGQSGPVRFLLKNGVVQAGMLAGLTPGTSVAIYAGPVGGEPVAAAHLEQVTPTTAALVVETGDLPDGGYAEVTVPAAPPPLILSLPVPANTFDGYDYRGIVSAVNALAENGALPNVVFQADGFDAGLVLTDGTIAVTGQDGVLDPDGAESSTRIPLDRQGDLVAQLEVWLNDFARITRLRQVLADYERARGFGFGGGLVIKAERLVGDASKRKCAKSTAQPEAFAFRGDTALAHCDKIWLTLENQSVDPQDVSVLYVDRDNHVSALWPQGFLSNRLTSGESKRIGLQIVSPWPQTGHAARGFEEILILSVQNTPDAARVDLTGLAGGKTDRDTAPGGLETLLAAVVENDGQNRSLSFDTAVLPLKVTRYRFEVFPQDQPD